MIIKGLLWIARGLVGALFIFSGLIKINDPVGTAIKLEEYFDVFSSDIAGFFSYFKALSLPLAVFLVVAELALGVMILVGWRLSLAVKLLLAMTLFFTFLTFYSAYFDKVTDCGCFGDAIKLTPWESFYKDVFLLVLIGFLFRFRGKLETHFGGWRKWAVVGSFFIGLVLSITAIRNLPFIDFRAFKEGVNIKAAMEPSAPLEYSYVMKKGDETIIFDQYPSGDEYEFVEMTINNPEALPKISDFAVWNEEGDYTDAVLEGEVILILTSNLDKMSSKNMDEISGLVGGANAKGIAVKFVGASSEDRIQNLLSEMNWDIGYYLADATVVKTIIRSNPGIVILNEGTVVKKYHHNNTPDIETVLKELGL
ncbi:BT_3928 family protein [Pleomorphovibrio marinus]|uniref:BT_3928 family protein n=1 Tax=Pleomorphovibrio marinus TaxID=2164132 RepID=UPI000E0B796D|nr:BT_3928 family protein [Pleomorphovibrio marinus]